MEIFIVLALTFVSGAICSQMDSWEVFIPFAAGSGLFTGLVAKFLGVM